MFSQFDIYKKINGLEEVEDSYWDFLIYIFTTLLNHPLEKFDETTPRFLFSQFDIYKKINGLEEVEDSSKEKKNKELNSVEDFF